MSHHSHVGPRRAWDRGRRGVAVTGQIDSTNFSGASRTEPGQALGGDFGATDRGRSDLAPRRLEIGRAGIVGLELSDDPP
ncbi:MAG TPA: hypothetical protein VID04_12110, partial [Methylomirabilota bacterium]